MRPCPRPATPPAFQTLTLASDAMTKSNIGAPVKQLSCIGGCQGDLRMLQCENKVKKKEEL